MTTTTEQTTTPNWGILSRLPEDIPLSSIIGLPTCRTKDCAQCAAICKDNLDGLSILLEIVDEIYRGFPTYTKTWISARADKLNCSWSYRSKYAPNVIKDLIEEATIEKNRANQLIAALKESILRGHTYNAAC